MGKGLNKLSDGSNNRTGVLFGVVPCGAGTEEEGLME